MSCVIGLFYSPLFYNSIIVFSYWCSSRPQEVINAKILNHTGAHCAIVTATKALAISMLYPKGRVVITFSRVTKISQSHLIHNQYILNLAHTQLHNRPPNLGLNCYNPEYQSYDLAGKISPLP